MEKYRLAYTSIGKRKADQQLDCIEVLSDSYFSNIFWSQASMFSSEVHVSSIIMGVFFFNEKTVLSSLSWDVTIQDGITNLLLKLNIGV